MNYFKKTLAVSMAFALIFTAVGCSKPIKSQEQIRNTMVAKIYEQEITLGDIDDAMGLGLNRGIASYEEIDTDSEMYNLVQNRLETLDTMLNDIIFKNKAEELGIMPSEEELVKKSDEQLSLIKKSFESDEQFQNALANAGFIEVELIEELKLSAIFEVVYEYVTKNVTVTEDEINKYFKANKYLYTEQPSKIKTSHILVKEYNTAKEVIEKLNNGADFAELAAEYGTDSTKYNGGELNWIDYNNKNIYNSFLEAAIELEEGEYTKTPVRTKYGHHIILCLEKEEYPLLSLDEAREKVEEDTLNDKKYKVWTNQVKEWHEEANVKIYENRLNQ